MYILIDKSDTMSDNSLNKLCMNKLVETFVNAPPMIRDMVTENVSIEIIKEQKQRIRNNTTNDVCEQNKILIPEIVKWIIASGTTYPMILDDRITVYTIYKNFNRNVVDAAIDIAEDILCYIDTSRVVHWSRYNEMDSSSNEEDSDYDY